MAKLTEKAKAVCKTNYKENCGGCELRVYCVYTQIHSRIEEWDEMIENINRLAEEVQV